MKQFIIVISTVETRCLLQMGSRHPLRAATLHSATPLTCRAGTLLERTTSPSWLRRSCSTGNLTCSEQASDLFSSSCAETHSLCARKRWGFIAVYSKFLLLCVLLHTEKPVERTASVEADRAQLAASTAKPLPPEDLFGSVPFVASAGKF